MEVFLCYKVPSLNGFKVFSCESFLICYEVLDLKGGKVTENGAVPRYKFRTFKL